MRRALIASAVLSISLLGYGCAKNNNKEAAPQAHGQEGQEGPSWTLLVKSDCAGEDAESCIAAHGFSISSDGKYEVGPGPTGQVKTGMVTTGDANFKEVEAILDRSINQASFAADAPAKCTAIEMDPNTINPQETITLTRKSVQKPIYRSTQEETCYQTASVDEARSLHDALMKLAATYYVVPFPNACAEAVGALQALYPTVAACTTDTECSYIDPSFEPILPDFNQFVTTGSCDMAKPMVVANLNSFIAHQSDFEKASHAVATACAGQNRNGGECGLHGFNNSASFKPICGQGTCRVNPSAVIH